MGTYHLVKRDGVPLDVVQVILGNTDGPKRQIQLFLEPRHYDLVVPTGSNL